MTEKLVLETEGLYASYGKQPILYDLSLHVPEGKIYGFLGLNGAGKSTTIRIILGLFKATSGKVRLFGSHTASENQKMLRHIGSLVEAPGFYEHLSGADNLRIAQILRDLPEKTIDDALEATGLGEVGKKPVKQYSLGMRQRLGLAWALLGNPRLLILDEPINGLDPAGVREVRGLLQRLSQERGVTIFLSSHILAEVQQLADRIGVIHQGRLIKELNSNEFNVTDWQTIRIRCHERARVLEALRLLNWVDKVELKNCDQIEAQIPVERTGELNGSLNRAGYQINEFAWIQTDLEEFFLKITGSAQDA